jgi:hypothetical protein
MYENNFSKVNLKVSTHKCFDLILILQSRFLLSLQNISLKFDVFTRAFLELFFIFRKNVYLEHVNISTPNIFQFVFGNLFLPQKRLINKMIIVSNKNL